MYLAFKLRYKRQQKSATCLATLLQNELKDDAVHFTTHESNLSCNKAGCCKLRELWLLIGSNYVTVLVTVYMGLASLL